MEDFQTDTPGVLVWVGVRKGRRVTLKGSPWRTSEKNDATGIPAKAIAKFGREFLKNASPAG